MKPQKISPKPNHYKFMQERLRKSGLSPVSVRMERLLTNQSKYVDFADLLPATNWHAATTSINETIINRDPNTRAIVVSFGPGKKLVNTSFPLWVRAQYVLFYSYRTHHFPEFKYPLTKYMDIAASLADPANGYPLLQWRVYDIRYCPSARMYPDHPVIWSYTDQELFRECMMSPRPPAVKQSNFTIRN